MPSKRRRSSAVSPAEKLPPAPSYPMPMLPVHPMGMEPAQHGIPAPPSQALPAVPERIPAPPSQALPAVPERIPAPPNMPLPPVQALSPVLARAEHEDQASGGPLSGLFDPLPTAGGQLGRLGRRGEQHATPAVPALGRRDIRSGKALGGGSAHDVHRVRTRKTMPGTDTRTGYFKADTAEKEDAASASPYDADIGQGEQPHMAARAVASARLDAALGTHVLSQDRFGTYKGQAGLVSPEVAGESLYDPIWVQGHAEEQKKSRTADWEDLAVDEKARKNGKKWELKAGNTFRDFDLSRPETQRSFADLQLNDYLSGQVDRHGRNIKIDQDGHVTGIDNDLAFGKTDLSTHDVPMGHHARSEQTLGDPGNRLLLPQQVDAATAERFMKMSEEDFVRTIAGDELDPSRLDAEEIDAAKARYQALQTHVRGLADADQLVHTWDDQTYAQGTADPNLNSSYLNRSATVLEGVKDGTGSPAHVLEGDVEKREALESVMRRKNVQTGEIRPE